ncbi:hypothetical protein TNCV_1115811 [Trichonephila clavipes]|nr:hypothetical protein TNCV_1115811 [Trichonephila clavipes]
MARHQGPSFQQDNVRSHTDRISLECLRAVNTLLWPAWSPDSGTPEYHRPGTATATRGLLAMDHAILNHGHVTWTKLKLAPSSPNYHTTPTGERLSSRQI